MMTLARFLFFSGLFFFGVAAVFWYSMDGVIAWRIGMALIAVSLGLGVLWAGEKDTEDHGEKRPHAAVPFMLHAGSIVAILIALGIYGMGEGMGLAAIYILTVALPILAAMAVGWYLLGSKHPAPLMDRLLPLAALILFSLPFTLDIIGLMKRVPVMELIAGIIYLGFVLLAFALYRLHHLISR